MRAIAKSNIAHSQYFELIEKIYGVSSQTNQFVRDSIEGMNTVLADTLFSTSYFHLLENDNLVGHIGLLSASKEEACFGFFELTNPAYFQDLWQALVEEAKRTGVKNIFGPVNGTVWHPYRVISESSPEPFFIHEPLSSLAYFDLFKSSSPAHIIEYHSAYRTTFENILALTKSSLDTLNTEKVHIAQEKFSSGLLKVIYDLSVSIFSRNPGYYPLSFNDFMKLYADPESDKTKVKIFIALHENKPIGFSYNLLREKKLIMKTIGLLPGWQEKGIGNALVHEVHRFAHDNDIQKIIYALIRTDNRVKHFPKDDAVIFRKYAAFNYTIL